MVDKEGLKGIRVQAADVNTTGRCKRSNVHKIMLVIDTSRRPFVLKYSSIAEGGGGGLHAKHVAPPLYGEGAGQLPSVPNLSCFIDCAC